MIPADLQQGYYTAAGTVLLRRDSSREGLSLLLFLRGYGPRWVNAPSAAAKNRFGGAAEPLTWCEYTLYQSPSGLYLRGAEVKEDFIALRTMPSALLSALRIYKLAAKESPQRCENDALLRLLWNALLQLRAKCHPKAVEFRFEWKMLSIMGGAPSLEICAGCGRPLSDGGAFTREGILCRSCAAHGEEITGGEGLTELKRAVFLPHERFIQWACGGDTKEHCAANLKKLSPYFSYMR